jgi:hypothetical protein
MLCPHQSTHVLGRVTQDTVRTAFSGDVQFDGPLDDPRRNVRWACVRCDRASQAAGELSRQGKAKQHLGVVEAGPLLRLLESMGKHGPDMARVSLVTGAIEQLTARVVSGEQLKNAQHVEQARVRRHRGTDGPKL